MTDFLFGAVLDPLSARIEFYCVKDKNGETTFYHIIDYFIDNSATVLIFAVSVDRLLAVAFPIFLPRLRQEHSRGHCHCLRLVLLHGVQFNSASGRR